MSMENWASLLGLPLEKALETARAWGYDPKVLVTCAPPRKGNVSAAPREGSLRVIRARENEVTVSTFMDGDPKTEL